MPKFTHLKRLEIKKDKTVSYAFEDIKGRPKLEVSPATESNKPYLNSLLKRSSTKRAAKKKKISTDILARNREDDKKLYSKYIVKGWEKVVDDTGKKVPFSIENCIEFFECLPNWIFDDLRIFCSDIGNFLEDFEEMDSEEVSKN